MNLSYTVCFFPPPPPFVYYSCVAPMFTLNGIRKYLTFCLCASMCFCVRCERVHLKLSAMMMRCCDCTEHASPCKCHILHTNVWLQQHSVSVCGWTRCMPLHMLHTGLCALQDLRVMLMDVYRKMQAPTRAFPHLPKIIEGKKDDPACLIVAGDLARRSSDFQMALQCFDQVQTMDNPQLAEMVSLFCCCCWGVGWEQSAIGF